MSISYIRLFFSCMFLISLASPALIHAEDLSVEPDVVDLGEPKNQPAPEEAQQIQAAIQQIKNDIQQIEQTTNNELASMQQEIDLLEKTPGNKDQIQTIKQKMHDLKHKSKKEIKALNHKLKQLNREAAHKFHKRHESY